MTTPRVFRDATGAQIERLTRTLVGARLFPDAEALRAIHADQPWRIQVSDRADVAVLGRWRDHLPLLAIEALWCPFRFVPDAITAVSRIAREHGYTGVVSPPVSQDEAPAYAAGGMAAREWLITLDARADADAVVSVSPGVTLRVASLADVPGLLELDAACFDSFWRYDRRLLERFTTAGAITVAERDERAVGYTLCTVDREASVLGRLCVLPSERRRGVGRMLVSDAVGRSGRAGARHVTLSMQADNESALALYASVGFRPTGRRYAFMTLDTGPEAAR